jgi:hypothetical protein
MNTDWNDLIQRHIAGLTTDDEAQRLSDALKTEDELADLYIRHIALEVALEACAASAEGTRELLTSPEMAESSRSKSWFAWRPLMAAAAGIVFGMLCTSMVFAYALPSASVVSTKVLSLANACFESGSQVPALGVPAAAGEWRGDYSRVVTAENGITPKKGQQMLRFLRSDNELSSKNESSYVGDVVQVIDMRSLRAEMSGAEQMVELSAWFNSISTPGVRYEFAVKAATFRGDISDAPRLWLDRDASASSSNHFVVADSDLGTWQRVAVPLMVPPDADFIVINCAVVFKGSQLQGATEFPGHYLDHVEMRLNRSPGALADIHDEN